MFAKIWHSFQLKPKWWLFLILFVVQFLYIISMSAVSVVYYARIGENMQNIITPLQDANYDEAAIKAGASLVQDPAVIYSSYQDLVHNIRYLVGFQLLIFLVLGTLLWAVTHLFWEKKFFKVWGELIIRALVFLVPIGLIVYLLFKNILAISFVSVYATLAIVFASLYFMGIALSIPLHSLKNSLTCAFALGSKEIPYALGVLVPLGLIYWILLAGSWSAWTMIFAITLLVLAALGCLVFFIRRIPIIATVLGGLSALAGMSYIVSLSIEWPVLLMVLLVLVLIGLLTLVRVFFVAIVRELDIERG